MRDDLLEAQASVHWAVSQLPAFAERLRDWLSLNVDVGPKEAPPPATHNPIIATVKNPLPLSFNVEMGAYINAIRSSLDLLATALAHRCNVPRPDDAYFPVAASEDDFLRGNYKGSKFVKSLPDPERGIIEALKPYEGGNLPLWLMHQLDIIRKHKKLIDVEVNPAGLSIIGNEAGAIPTDFVPVATGWLRVNEETVLGLIRKGAPDYEMKFVPYIAVNEPGLVESKPAVALLNYLASYAEARIALSIRADAIIPLSY